MKNAIRATVGTLDDQDRKHLVNYAPAGAVRTTNLNGSEDVSGPKLAANDYVESILDADFPSINAPYPLVVHLLPSTTPLLVFQYRTHSGSIRHFGRDAAVCPQHDSAGTVLKSGVIKVVANDATGVVLVRLKPELASLVLGEDLSSFADIKVDAAVLFGREAVSLLEEQLHEASTSSQRIQLVLSFLHARTRSRFQDPIVIIAARMIRSSPKTRTSALSSRLQISERQLSRRFHKVIGSTPKQFSRLARFEKIIAARSLGSSWADVSYACGFNDQAHMIKDVGLILGDSPHKVIGALGVQGKDCRDEFGQQHILVW